MNNLFLVSLMMLGSLSAFATEKEVKVNVNGMVCAFCAQGISKKFSNDASVEKVNVSLENKIVTLKLKDGKAITDDTIKKVLKDAGYSVSSIQRE